MTPETATPARPGPGPMPRALLDTLDVTLRRRVRGLLPGEARSSALGPGSELAQLRQYEPGDDVRLIDWNATARTGEPHVRVEVAERALTTWLLVDTSLSMTFGTADRRKADVAEGVARAFGHVATRRGNRLAVLRFGGAEPRTLPPRQGRAGQLGLALALRGEDECPVGATSLGDALGRAGRLARRGALVVLVSDFRGPPGWRPELVRVAARNHVVAVEVRDPREEELTDVGDLWLVDAETSQLVRVDTSSRTLRSRYAERAAGERREVADLLRKAGADHVVLSTAGEWLRELARFLRRLEVRR